MKRRNGDGENRRVAIDKSPFRRFTDSFFFLLLLTSAGLLHSPRISFSWPQGAVALLSSPESSGSV